jgi:hypothetical protein
MAHIGPSVSAEEFIGWASRRGTVERALRCNNQFMAAPPDRRRIPTIAHWRLHRGARASAARRCFAGLINGQATRTPGASQTFRRVACFCPGWSLIVPGNLSVSRCTGDSPLVCGPGLRAPTTLLVGILVWPWWWLCSGFCWSLSSGRARDVSSASSSPIQLPPHLPPCQRALQPNA